MDDLLRSCGSHAFSMAQVTCRACDGPWNLLLLGGPRPDHTDVSSNRSGGADVERTQDGALGKTGVKSSPFNLSGETPPTPRPGTLLEEVLIIRA